MRWLVLPTRVKHPRRVAGRNCAEAWQTLRVELSLADELILRVSSLGDPQTRVAMLKVWCAGLEPDALAQARAEIALRAARHETNAQVTQLALAAAIVPDVEHPSFDKESSDTQGNDWGTGRALTLGERKALARKPDKRFLERALHDAHPAVVQIVLLNPRLTELDVARMCASKKASPAALRTVFSSAKWIAREQVRRAIAFNPRTPVDVATALLPLLARVDLRSVVEDERLEEQVREMAKVFLDPSRHREELSIDESDS